MRPPDFWQDRSATAGRLLAPLGWLYAEATQWRLRHAYPLRASVPVVCVGNLTVGGTGKTPVVRDLAERLTRAGRHPHILSRGYGGQARGPLRVDPARHQARDVGDEPLLLMRDAPCWVASDRAAGAHAIVAAGGDTILMDDGLQNPDLIQNLRLAVIDGEIGFGNERALPAGPLRERLDRGLARIDAVIIIGDDRHGLVTALRARLDVLEAYLVPREASWLRGQRVIGFTGIGRPGKFRDTLADQGADIAAFHEFADHHPYRESELRELARDAERSGATLVTTEKDWIRLDAAWRTRVRAVPVVLQWRDETAVASLLARISAHV